MRFSKKPMRDVWLINLIPQKCFGCDDVIWLERTLRRGTRWQVFKDGHGPCMKFCKVCMVKKKLRESV
jgi:hypothetical protein